MSDMPSAREHGLYDLRRKRAPVAMGIVSVAAFVAAIVQRDPAFVALPVVALLAFVALPSWIGVEPRFPVPSVWRAIGEQALGFGVPMVGVLLMYVVLNKGEPRYIALIPVAVAGALIYSAYRWRYLAGAMARVRGAGEEMGFGSRLWRHYLGYAVGLAAAFTAAAATRPIDWGLGSELFAVVLLSAKAGVDLSLPQPPLRAERLSLAGARLAAMSPVLFGLPWGLALTGAMAASMPETWSMMAALNYNAMIVVYVAIASIVVFTAFALVTFLIELMAGEG